MSQAVTVQGGVGFLRPWQHPLTGQAVTSIPPQTHSGLCPVTAKQALALLALLALAVLVVQLQAPFPPTSLLAPDFWVEAVAGQAVTRRHYALLHLAVGLEALG
jgi:hypothetical protein